MSDGALLSIKIGLVLDGPDAVIPALRAAAGPDGTQMACVAPWEGLADDTGRVPDPTRGVKPSRSVWGRSLLRSSLDPVPGIDRNQNAFSRFGLLARGQQPTTGAVGRQRSAYSSRYGTLRAPRKAPKAS